MSNRIYKPPQFFFLTTAKNERRRIKTTTNELLHLSKLGRQGLGHLLGLETFSKRRRLNSSSDEGLRKSGQSKAIGIVCDNH